MAIADSQKSHLQVDITDIIAHSICEAAVGTSLALSRRCGYTPGI